MLNHALRHRAELLAKARAFFDTRGFLEVQTPILSADTVVDRHLDPFSLSYTRKTWYLQTSPEFHMKRLLADGAEAIYQITRAFRQDERGPLHNPEFTIVEWYRAGDGYDEGMALLGELAETILNRGPAERLSYIEAFEQYVQLHPLAVPVGELQSAAQQRLSSVPELEADDRDGWLDLLLSECIQPHLGRDKPLILYDYPASQSALANVRNETHPVAERFELFVDGVELANGYHELTDPAELRRRNAEVNHQRRRDGKECLPEESRLLEAMDRGLPLATGVALGFDRMLMVALGATSLDAVIAFPWESA